MKELGVTISAVISLVVYWWTGKTDVISIAGNVNPTNVRIGEDVILSCQVRNCRSPILKVHLYKWESSENKTVYILDNTTQPSIQGSNSGEREKNRTQKGQYINGYLEVTLIKVKAADAGQYVCALTCGHVYKEVTMEMIPGGIINSSVGEEVILPCPLIAEHELFYLKMQWRRIHPGKHQTIYSYLLQNTSAVVYSEDTLGHRCTSSDGPSTRVWFGKKYRQKAEVFKGNEFRNKNGYLKLKNIQEEDAGKYLCSVKSNLLHKEVTFQLSVKGIQDEDTGISMFHSSVHLYFLYLLLLVLANSIDNLNEEKRQWQIDKEELRNLQKEVDNLNEEKGQWQIDKEELQKLQREVDNLNEEKRQWQIDKGQWQTDKEELQKLKCEVELRRACSYTDTITLDAASAHPNLSIDVIKKSFTYEPQPLSVSANPQRFDGIVSVLGREGFSFGNHYWTVDIGSSSDWDLGVARRSIKRKGQFSVSPKEGFWVLGRSGKDYWAKTDPWTRLIVQKRPSKIGVYLSFQPKEVTFFNVVDKSVLFVFRDCSFKEEIFPFFKNTHKGTTMIICSMKEEKA